MWYNYEEQRAKQVALLCTFCINIVSVGCGCIAANCDSNSSNIAKNFFEDSCSQNEKNPVKFLEKEEKNKEYDILLPTGQPKAELNGITAQKDVGKDKVINSNLEDISPNKTLTKGRIGNKSFINSSCNNSKQISMKDVLNLPFGVISVSTSVCATGCLLYRFLKNKKNNVEPKFIPIPNKENSDSDNLENVEIQLNNKKDLNLLNKILWVVGSVLLYIVLHYIVKAFLFQGSLRGKRKKSGEFNDIEKLEINNNSNANFFIAYKTDSNEKLEKNERKTIILSFGGNLTNGRNKINKVRVGVKFRKGKLIGDNFEVCNHGENCKICEKQFDDHGKLLYTISSFTPGGYYSDQNILKKVVYDVGENALYKDAQALYDYVTDVLGYENVIVHGFCQGGPVAAYLVKYAEEKAEYKKERNKVKALILDSPMDGIYSSVSKIVRYKLFSNGIFGKIFGPISGLVANLLLPFNSLSTYENLKNIKNKDLPIICLSGADKDFLSLDKTNLDKRLQSIGFSKVNKKIDQHAKHESTFDNKFVDFITNQTNEI